MVLRHRGKVLLANNAILLYLKIVLGKKYVSFKVNNFGLSNRPVISSYDLIESLLHRL
jgi:hypothetical protein